MEKKIIFPKACGCGNLIGCYQRDIENKLYVRKKEITTKEEEIAIEFELLKEYGLTKICCRNCYIGNKQTPFLRNSNENAYVDNRHKTNSKIKMVNLPCLIVVPKRKPPDFPIAERYKNKDKNETTEQKEMAKEMAIKISANTAPKK